MSSRHEYDVIVVGAGPAGLSAARTAARLGFSTLVLERLAAPGQLGHPCSAIVAPVPRASRTPSGELYFRKIDLAIPASLVLGYPEQQYWIDPAGHEYAGALGGSAGHPAASIDKAGLLQLLANQASLAGAAMRYGTEVTGLIQDHGRVRGVLAHGHEFRARMVLSAEGVTRKLSAQVLPSGQSSLPTRCGYVASANLSACCGMQTGQWLALGRKYTSARDGLGMLVAPAPGRMSAHFILLAESMNHYTEKSARFYLQEFIYSDPRVRDLCGSALLVSETVSPIKLAPAPDSIVADGFMAIGDSVAPAGFLGILPAIYLGRQAALVAADAIDVGQTSIAHLMPYETVYRRRIRPALEGEARTLVDLLNLPDVEVTGLCSSVSKGIQALPFSAHLHALEWDIVGGRAAPNRTAVRTCGWPIAERPLALAAQASLA